MSPFQALYGRLPPPLLPYIGNSSKVEAVDALLADRDQILQTIRHNLLRAQDRMKAQADKHRRDMTLEPGSLALVKLIPYRQTSLRQHRYSKLNRRYFGPFTVLERIGPVAYRLDLPQQSQIHPVFHITLLKPYFNNTTLHATPLPEHSWLNHPIVQPEIVLQTRTLCCDNQEQLQYLVQWKGFSPSDATWVSALEFKHSYPDFDLEDKVVSSSREGVVTTTNNAIKPSTSNPAETNHGARPHRIKRTPEVLKDYYTS